MPELSVAICDDLAEERVWLARLVRAYCQQCGLALRLELFPSGERLLGAFTRPRQFQIVFLDIYMPGCSGVDVARRIRAVDRDVSILFATTSQDHGLESFQVQASDYLVKPIRPEDVARALDWWLAHIPEPLRCLCVSSEWERREIPLFAIQYIEVRGHQSNIHTAGQVVPARRGLDELERAIDSRDFLRCHRSFLVNMNYIAGLAGADFRMADGSRVPIRCSDAARIRSRFIDWTYRKAWEQI